MRTKLALATFFAGIQFFNAAQAGILDFSGPICTAAGAGGQLCAGNVPIDTAYGDIPGQLDVGYRVLNTDGTTAQPFLRWWQGSYPGLDDGLAFGANNLRSEISFTPAPGYQVALTSLELGSFQGTSRTSQVLVFEGNNAAPVYDVSFSVGATSVFPTPNVTSANKLTLRWGQDTDGVAIDNVVFTVTVVPEPETYAMLGIGLGIVGLLACGRRKV